MSVNNTVNSNFWISDYIHGLIRDKKYLFLYLLTNPFSNIAGIYKISLRQMVFDTDIKAEKLLTYFDEFKADKAILYKSGWICIPNRQEYNKKENHNIMIGVNRIIENSPDFIKEFINLHYNLPNDFKSFEIIANDDINTNTNSNSNIDINSNKDKTTNEIFLKIRDYWNSKDYLKKVRDLTPDRVKKLNSLIKIDVFKNNYERLIDRLKFSSFCNGENDRGWMASFDWFLYNDNKITYIKIYEFAAGLFTDEDINRYCYYLKKIISGNEIKRKKMHDAGYTSYLKEFSQPHQLESILYNDDFDIDDIIRRG